MMTAPPPYVAMDGVRPKTSQSAMATKKTESTLANDPNIGSVQMTSTTNKLMETTLDQCKNNLGCTRRELAKTYWTPKAWR